MRKIRVRVATGAKIGKLENDSFYAGNQQIVSIMNTNIKATKIKLTPAIRDYVEEKVGTLQKLIGKGDSGARADVEVGKTTRHHISGDIFRAEINLKTGGKLFRAVSKKSDLYVAIDDAKDDLMRQLRRNKGKKADLARRGGLQFKKLIRRLGRRD